MILPSLQSQKRHQLDVYTTLVLSKILHKINNEYKKTLQNQQSRRKLGTAGGGGGGGRERERVKHICFFHASIITRVKDKPHLVPFSFFNVKETSANQEYYKSLSKGQGWTNRKV